MLWVAANHCLHVVVVTCATARCGSDWLRAKAPAHPGGRCRGLVLEPPRAYQDRRWKCSLDLATSIAPGWKVLDMDALPVRCDLHRGCRENYPTLYRGLLGGA